MKKFIAFVVAFISATLTACNSSETVFDEINYEVDNQTYFYLFSQVVSNSDGYFFVQDRTVYFFDRETKTTVPLCSKINCEHNRNSKNCNAYIYHRGNTGIWYYDNEIYFVSYNPDTYYYFIEAVATDGSKRRNVCNLFKKDVEDAENISFGNDIEYIMLHRGYAYYLIHSEEGIYQIYRIKLKRFAKSELLYESDFTFFLKGFGNKVYFLAGNLTSAEEYNELDNSLCAYDIQNSSVSVVLDNISIGDFFVVQDNLFYMKDMVLIKHSLSTGEEQVAYSFGRPGILSYDGQYFYFDNDISSDKKQTDRTILILNNDFSVADEIPLDKKYVMNFFGDKDYMFCLYSDESGMTTVAFDKSGIGTGELDCIKLVD